MYLGNRTGSARRFAAPNELRSNIGARALQVDISALLRDAPTRHQDETAVLTADPFLAEIAKYAAHLNSTQKSIFLNHVRELSQGRARRSA